MWTWEGSEGTLGSTGPCVGVDAGSTVLIAEGAGHGHGSADSLPAPPPPSVGDAKHGGWRQIPQVHLVLRRRNGTMGQEDQPLRADQSVGAAAVRLSRRRPGGQEATPPGPLVPTDLLAMAAQKWTAKSLSRRCADDPPGGQQQATSRCAPRTYLPGTAHRTGSMQDQFVDDEDLAATFWTFRWSFGHPVEGQQRNDPAVPTASWGSRRQHAPGQGPCPQGGDGAPCEPGGDFARRVSRARSRSLVASDAARRNSAVASS